MAKEIFELITNILSLYAVCYVIYTCYKHSKWLKANKDMHVNAEVIKVANAIINQPTKE